MLRTRQEIRTNLEKIIAKKEPLLGVAVGSGISARYAEKGGADFLMVLNAGIFRMAGISSTAALLPYGNANKMVLDIGENRILPIVKDIPVIFGLCCTDTTVNKKSLLTKISAIGFTGVTNYPSVGIVDGILKNHLEENNLSFEQEVKLIKLAIQLEMFTIAFVFNEQQAIKMAQINPDIICINFGWTGGGEQAPNRNISLEMAINKANNIFTTIKKINSNVIIMVYGGPINSPEAANYLFNKTQVQGYIGGSVFERIPLEKEIVKITRQYKMFTSMKSINSKRLRQELRKEKSFGKLVGKSKPMQEIYSIIDQIADKKVNVLITGESGTGKELVAKAIHYYGGLSEAPFIPINTASIPYNLLESELFGHEKGSYTGAFESKKGKFEIADGGTLFLDEIADMPLGLQAKILRAIEEQEIQPVGAERFKKINVRILAATNKDLKILLSRGRFREDLYYRLNVVNINLPPLKDRKEDIPLLIQQFIKENNNKYGLEIEDATDNFYQAAFQYDWPGNIRELKNAVERAHVLNDPKSKYLPSEHLPVHISSLVNRPETNNDKFEEATNRTDLKSKLNLFERRIIFQTLNKFNFNISRSAENLNITRKTLRNKMQKYNLKKK